MKSTTCRNPAAFIFTLIFWIASHLNYGQPYFQKVFYDSPFDQEGQDVLPTADGGYLIAAYTSNSTFNDQDIEVVKADASGALVWKKTYGGNKPDFPYHMLQAADGNYFIIGYSQSYGGGDYDVLLLKIDPAGNTIWLKTYGGWGNDQGLDIIATSDGNYMIVGNSNSAAMADQDMFLIKIDPAGTVIWNKWLGGSSNDFGNSIQQCSDGGYIVLGNTFSFGAGGDAYLVKTDAGGNIAWTKTFGGALYDEGVYLHLNTDGSYTFVVRDSSTVGHDIDVRIIKTDMSGNVIWNKAYGGTKKDTPKMIQSTMDGGYVVAAITRSFGLITPDMWIVKLDANGDTTWTRRYGGNQNEHCYVVRELSDGSLIATGKTSSYSPDFEIIFLKMNSSGTLTVGMEETMIHEHGFTIFPNPFNERFVLDAEPASVCEISITDVCGQEVYRNNNVTHGRTEIVLNDRSAGVYFITVQGALRSFTRKIILNK